MVRKKDERKIGLRNYVLDGDAVAALGLAGAGVLDGVFGCDFCGEGEREEEGEEGEESEAHDDGAFFGDMWIEQEDSEGTMED